MRVWIWCLSVLCDWNVARTTWDSLQRTLCQGLIVINCTKRHHVGDIPWSRTATAMCSQFHGIAKIIISMPDHHHHQKKKTILSKLPFCRIAAIGRLTGSWINRKPIALIVRCRTCTIVNALSSSRHTLKQALLEVYQRLGRAFSKSTKTKICQMTIFWTWAQLWTQVLGALMTCPFTFHSLCLTPIQLKLWHPNYDWWACHLSLIIAKYFVWPEFTHYTINSLL